MRERIGEEPGNLSAFPLLASPSYCERRQHIQRKTKPRSKKRKEGRKKIQSHKNFTEKCLRPREASSPHSNLLRLPLQIFRVLESEDCLGYILSLFRIPDLFLALLRCLLVLSLYSLRFCWLWEPRSCVLDVFVQVTTMAFSTQMYK